MLDSDKKREISISINADIKPYARLNKFVDMVERMVAELSDDAEISEMSVIFKGDTNI